MFSTFPSCSQMTIVFYHSVIIHGLGFLYLLSKTREYEYGMTSLFRIILGPHSMYSGIGIIASQSSGLFGFIPLIFIPE